MKHSVPIYFPYIGNIIVKCSLDSEAKVCQSFYSQNFKTETLVAVLNGRC